MTARWGADALEPRLYRGRHRREFTNHDRRRDMDTHHARYVGLHRAEVTPWSSPGR